VHCVPNDRRIPPLTRRDSQGAQIMVAFQLCPWIFLETVSSAQKVDSGNFFLTSSVGDRGRAVPAFTIWYPPPVIVCRLMVHPPHPQKVLLEVEPPVGRGVDVLLRRLFCGREQRPQERRCFRLSSYQTALTLMIHPRSRSVSGKRGLTL